MGARLVIDDLRYMGFDRAKHWHAPAVRLGLPWTRRQHLALSALG